MNGNSMPEGWERIRLGNQRIASIIMGQSPSSSSYNSDGAGLPFYQGKADFGMKHPTPTKWCSSPSRVAQAGDILISVRAPVGDVNIATEKCCIGRGVGAIRHGAEADGDFLFYALLCERERIAGLGTGAIFASINKNILYDFELDIPPLPEQHAIAGVLSKLQGAVEAQDKIIATLKELKAATLAKLFREGLRGQVETTETAYGPIPDHWPVSRLDQCAEVQTGVAKGKKLNGGQLVERPYLRVANVQDGYLDLREIKVIQLRASEVDRFSLRDGDVLLTEGGDFDKLGRGFIWHEQVKNCVHQNHIFAVRTKRALMLPEFLAYLIQSPYGKAYFLNVAHKTTNLACINSTKLKEFPVLLPPIEEQREIASSVAAIDHSIDAETQKQEALNRLFSSMLHILMSGELRLGIGG
jgi:type I restriction enzyme, S subunit